MKNSGYHESVMVREAVSTLNIKSGDKIIDATLGTGGHALEFLKEGAEVLGIERDPEMIKIAEKRLKEACPASKFKLILGNFSEIGKIAEKEGFSEVSGILFDLGVSNLQLMSEARGFSFLSPKANLDMRIDPHVQGVAASDLLNVLRRDQLEEMFSRVLDGSSARWVAERIIQQREAKPFETVGDFLKAIEGIRSKPGINPATLPFLAVRMAVNFELDNLKEALPRAFDLLKGGGKLLVITFHSGEDEIVKKFGKNRLIVPKDEEISFNPKARSAKLRIFVKG